MDPKSAFDICFEQLQGLRSLHGWRIHTSTPTGDDTVGTRARSGKPRHLPTPADYMANFAKAGKAALAHKSSRLVLFQTYYVGGATYEHARRHCSTSGVTFSDWMAEIRELVGRELLRRRIFPLSHYFKEPTRGTIPKATRHAEADAPAPGERCTGPQEARLARREAKFLMNSIARNGDSVASLRASIAVTPDMLRAFAEEYPTEQQWVTSSLGYRKMVLEEFDRLARVAMGS